MGLHKPKPTGKSVARIKAEECEDSITFSSFSKEWIKALRYLPKRKLDLGNWTCDL